MKDLNSLTARKIPALALGAVLLIFLLLSIVVIGCGNETGQANQLVGEVNDISANIKPKLAEAEMLLKQANNQLTAGQVDAEKASLTKAQQLLDETIPQIQSAKDKTNEAALLKISDNYRQYLQAKATSLDALITLTQADREYTSVFLADPLLSKPETRNKINDLQAAINQQINIINDAEAQANSIASSNTGEIEQ